LVSFISSFIFLDIASIVAESSHYCHSCEKNSVCWLIADLYLQPPSGSWWSCWGCCGSWSLPYIFLLKVSEHVCSCHDWTFQSSNPSSHIPVILGFSVICFVSADMISEGISVTFSLECYLFQCASGWLTLQVIERFYEVSKRVSTDADRFPISRLHFYRLYIGLGSCTKTASSLGL
jgi:hypothetical protein